MYDDLNMVLSSLFPVFALVILGKILRLYDFTHTDFLKTADRLVYFIFFPAMLFWKIGGASAAGIHWGLCFAALSGVAAIYLISSLCIPLFSIPAYQVGSYSQSCYRFNTYIGMAVIVNAVGEEGVRQFGIMVGFAIPFINVLAVSTLIWFSGRDMDLAQRGRMTLKALISNPLIIACLLGMLYSRLIGGFPRFVNNSFSLMTSVTLPLALLSIGGVLTFANVKGYLKISLLSSVLKLLVLPGIGYGFLRLFGVSGIPFKVGMIFFALPTSTAIYVLSSQLNSDTDLASASVVLSTVLSFISLSVILVISA